MRDTSAWESAECSSFTVGYDVAVEAQGRFMWTHSAFRRASVGTQGGPAAGPPNDPSRG
jgi:hypothetical protein